MFSYRVHRYIFLFGVLSLALGMMIGTVPTSVPEILLFCNWLLEMGFRRKWQLLKKNFLFWTLSVAYLIHVAGVFYSQDMDAALHDIRTKMPLMFLPLLFLSSPPLTAREIKWTFYCFIAGSFFNTAWCLVYSFVLHNNEVVRNASRFMSHIRLGLYLNMAIAACLYYWNHTDRKWLRAALLVLPLYFLSSMVLLGLASGLANFVLLGVAFAIVLLFRQRRAYKITGLSVVVLLAAVTLLYLRMVGESQLVAKDTPQNRPQYANAAGNTYIHFDTIGGQKENGYYVLMNIHMEELKRSWNRDFPADTFSYPRYNMLRYEVLVRYMTSKGLFKDSVGYLQLTEKDKINVQRGYTNYLQPGWSFLRRRSYELVNEYDEFVNGRAVNGHSFTMRLYFWKAALHAISKHILFGSGTGDVQAQLDKSYVETNSPLQEQWRIRPHNQFLTVTVALGVVGLLVFLFSLVGPVVRLHRELHPLYWPFYMLTMLSFLFEDTLETQAGLTFFAFFNAFLLCEAWLRKRGTPAGSQAPR